MSRLTVDFPALEGVCFLNSASMGAVPKVALDAVAGQLDLLGRGASGGDWGEYLDRFEAPVEAARREAQALLGAADDEVGLVADTTSGLHHAIDAIPFRPGDNVVLSDLEYPQVALAAANAAREHGIEIRFVRHRAGVLSTDAYRAAIDGRTRAVLASSVGWVTGQRIDLAALSALARSAGFFLVVDAVQQLGALSLDTSKLAIDFLMSGSYKWLAAPFGVGVFYVRRETHARGLRVRRLGLLGLEPPAGGWASFYDRAEMEPMPDLKPSATVHRFEAQGTPNRVGAAGLAASLRYRNALDSNATDRHVLELAGELRARLVSLGATIWTPEVSAERAGIVTFTFGGGAEEDKRLRSHLQARRIYVSARYCSGIGGVRVAVHFYNDRDDLDALFAAIEEFRKHG